MSYVFMPELVDYFSPTRNLSAWLEENRLLTQLGLDKVFDIEEAEKLEKDLRKETGKPVLVYNLQEMIAELDPKLPESLLVKVLGEHYEKAKATNRFYEYITVEPYRDEVYLRLIGIRYNHSFWRNWVQVTIQPTEKYQAKYRGQLRDKINVLTLGFHVEKKVKPKEGSETSPLRGWQKQGKEKEEQWLKERKKKLELNHL